MINQELLDNLSCPKCKKKVHLNEQRNSLICTACNLVYEIMNDIPIMLINEARASDEKKREYQDE